MQYHVDNPETVFADPEAKTKPAAYRAELKDSFEWFVGKIASMTTIEVCERHIQDAVR